MYSYFLNVHLRFYIVTKCHGPVKCGENRFCVGFEGQKVYCYGATIGCKWNSQDCTEDADCHKYSTNSTKYTDGDDVDCLNPVEPSDPWRADACKCEKGTYG